MNTVDQEAGEFTRTTLTPISELAKDSMNEQKQFEKTASQEAVEAERIPAASIDELVDESVKCLSSNKRSQAAQWFKNK